MQVSRGALPKDAGARLAAEAVVRKVGLRDGLQSIATTLPTEHKIEWLRGAHAVGLREIEVGSCVPPRLLPQLGDTAELIGHAKTLPGLVVSVLVPNLKGAERAIESGADLMILPLSASHAHSRANLRRTPDEVVAEMARIHAARGAAGSKTLIEGDDRTAFGCTIQGRVAPSEVLRLMQALLDAGADRVSLADTVGYADPRAVREIWAAAMDASKTSAMLFMIVGGASVFAHVITEWRIPQQIVDIVVAADAGVAGFLIAMMLLMFVPGMFLESIAIILVTTPVILPLMAHLGINPIWCGVLLTINLELAQITPPVGMNLFTIKAITHAAMGDVVRGSLPYAGLMLFALALVMIWPQIALWLPGTMLNLR